MNKIAESREISQKYLGDFQVYDEPKADCRALGPLAYLDEDARYRAINAPLGQFFPIMKAIKSQVLANRRRKMAEERKNENN